jgi:hypothetical protein
MNLWRGRVVTQEQYLNYLRSLHDNASLDVMPDPEADEDMPTINIDADMENSRISAIDEEIAEVLSSRQSDFADRRDEFQRRLQFV